MLPCVNCHFIDLPTDFIMFLQSSQFVSFRVQFQLTSRQLVLGLKLCWSLDSPIRQLLPAVLYFVWNSIGMNCKYHGKKLQLFPLVSRKCLIQKNISTGYRKMLKFASHQFWKINFLQIEPLFVDVIAPSLHHVWMVKSLSDSFPNCYLKLIAVLYRAKLFPEPFKKRFCAEGEKWVHNWPAHYLLNTKSPAAIFVVQRYRRQCTELYITSNSTCPSIVNCHVKELLAMWIFIWNVPHRLRVIV